MPGDSSTVTASADPTGPVVGAVVLGMGRSGTSAVTRALVASGFFAGAESDLMEPNVANPKGFWENLLVYRLNEEILGLLDATWFTPPPREAKLAARSWAVPRVQAVFQRLSAGAGGAPIALKEPRIGVLLEVWGPVIDASLHPVLVVRNPVEVATSLRARDGTPSAFALASWQLHMAGLLDHLRGRTVTVAPYSQLVLAPQAVRRFITDVRDQIAPHPRSRIDPDAALDAIAPELHREHAGTAELDDHLTGRQAELWRFLSGLELGTRVLQVPSELTRASEPARALAEHEIARTHYQLSPVGLEAQVRACQAAVADLRGALVGAERSRDAATEALATVRAHAQRAEIARARAEARLAAIQRSQSWRVTAPLRGVRRLARRLGSGEVLLHGDVLDPGLHEDAPARLVPGSLVEGAGVGLGVEDEAAGAPGAGLLIGEGQER